MDLALFLSIINSLVLLSWLIWTAVWQKIPKIEITITNDEGDNLLNLLMERKKKIHEKPLVPNAETIEALKAVERGELTRCNSIDDLFKSLNENNQSS